ncbi:MAG: SEL1-like repeat protein [Muribaculaceae bacterium]|nr:SEL1-like repeat protein [Muribaculaceae bacterium]
MKLKLILSSILLLSFGFTARPDDIYSDALLRKAQKGDMKAMFDLAHTYYSGVGTEKNRYEAVRWFEKSLAAGETASRVMLDWVNLREANFGYSLLTLAENGDPEAQYSLGYSLVFPDATISESDKYGDHKLSDPKLGKEFLEKAADQNLPDALYILGYMYLNGVHTEKNAVKGVDLLHKGAELGNSSAQYLYAACLMGGDGCQKNEQEGLEWLRKAADNGHPEAMYFIGRANEDGQYGMAVNIPEALKWYKKAYEVGSINACLQLGYLYYEGKKVEKNLMKTTQYWGTAKNLGSVQATNNLQAIAPEFSKQFPKLFKNMKKRAQQGDPEAITHIMALFLGDIPFQTNLEGGSHIEKAVEWINYGVEKNIADFYDLAAELYETGDIPAYLPVVERKSGIFKGYTYNRKNAVTPDLEKAAELYNKSIASNSTRRYNSLLRMAKANYEGDALVGGEKNYAACAWQLKDAIKILEKMAPSKELSDAYALLSKCYRFGRGVNQSEDKAEEYERKSMRLGNITGLRSVQFGF